MIELGRGLPVVMIPGIQGRWEWMRPAVRAMAASHRVFTFSLNEAPAASDCFAGWHTFIDRMLDRAGVDRAAIVGISFGGLVALRYAAHRPSRVRALVLVSSPAPTWQLDDRREGYLDTPVRSLPAFVWGAIGRLLPELRAARPSLPGRLACLAGHGLRVLANPASPSQMASWIRTWQALKLDQAWSPVNAPTLVVTGEPQLDRVVPTSTTLEYLKLIPGAQHRLLANTGHIGLISRPEAFAALVGQFLATT